MLALSMGFLCGASASAQISDVHNAVNKAGRERMLSQRIVKAYLAIGQGIDVERSRKVLDQSVALFDKQLVELKVFAPTPEIKDTYQKLDITWQRYKEIVIGAVPTPENARRLLELDAQVLELANRGTEQLQQHAGRPGARLVNMAGRQRMLSQLMAKHYLAAQWGLSPAESWAKADQARSEFVLAMKELRAAADRSAVLRQELEQAQVQWAFFENAINQRSGGADKARLSGQVATASERILELMENVTEQFEKESRS